MPWLWCLSREKKDALYLSSSTLGSNFLHCYIMTHLPCNPQVDIVHRTNHYLSSIINNCTVITCIVGLKKQFKALPTKSCSLDKATTRLSAKWITDPIYLPPWNSCPMLPIQLYTSHHRIQRTVRYQMLPFLPCFLLFSIYGNFVVYIVLGGTKKQG